jgi:hypothetical protein
MIQPEQFAQWNDFVNKLTEAYNENITLKKIPAAAPTTKKKPVTTKPATASK